MPWWLRGSRFSSSDRSSTVFYLRSKWKERPTTFLMPLFPFPALIALAGWLFVFGTSERIVIVYSLGSLAAGVVAFLIWEAAARKPSART